MSIQIPKSFTIEYSGRSNILQTNCGVSKHFNPNTLTGNHPPIESFICIWDTGATASVISKNVIDKLGLISTGFARSYHAQGESIVNTYIVNIYLPNHVGIPLLNVTEGILNGADVLVGMDIISQGDFTVCLNEGNTKFSFQLPSTHNFDFVKEYNDNYHKPLVKDKLPGRNDPCHCGSGKKYKNCHGR